MSQDCRVSRPACRFAPAWLGVVATLVCLAANARSPLEAVTGETPPLRTLDFTAEPPHGEHWFYYRRAMPGYIIFRKQDPLKKRLPGGEHLSFAIEVKAGKHPGHDLKSAEGLEAALKALLYMNAADYRYGMLRVESFAWQDTDCVSYLVSREEPEVLEEQPMVFLWVAEGFFCRHPANPEVAVIGSFQERRPAGMPTRVDDLLRQEAEQTLQGVRFIPATP